jgi:branched-chain amino acid aminotransferase
MDVYYVDGRFLPSNQAMIPVNDLAILRGYGVFDFLRTYGGKPFHLRNHLERLARSAHHIGLSFPWTLDELAGIVLETVTRNNCSEANIRIVITGGSSPDFITPREKPRLLVLVTPVPPQPEAWYRDGVKIITIPSARNIPDAKSINYIPATIALKKAARQEAVEAVYVSTDGKVLEGTTSNVFAFLGDELVTPGKGILPGITRQVILDITTDMYEPKIRDMTVEELLAAEEVFITSSNKEVVPVVQVDDTMIAGGKPGDRTRWVMKLFAEITGSE